MRITDIDGPAWFTHSVAEARQLVEVLAGERAVPDDLRSLVCENLWGDPSAPLGSRALDDVDVVVLEVSTTKSYTVGETRLNMHCLWNAARDLDLPTREVLRGAPVTWPESAGRVREVQVGRADPEEIRADVSAIAALAGAPVVLVDHIDARPGGEPLEERRAITGLLRRLESDGVAYFHATRPAIAALGEARALADSNHYLASAESVVAEALERSVSDVLRWASAPASRPPARTGQPPASGSPVADWR
jgi:hypothetical protein